MDNFIPAPKLGLGFVGDILGGAADILTDFIPGGDFIDNLLGIGGDADAAQSIFPQAPIAGGPSSNGTVAPTANGNTIGGCQVTVPVTQKTIHKAPRGYVVVTDPATGRKVGMLKGVASKCGLWKAPRKPPIKASDWRCLMRAEAVTKKLDRVVAASNKVVGKRRMTRSASR
tara:strand:- start:1597 stop:2112 length:516 start_codon:yes stop_codon:yes gene_type:complete